MPAGALRSALEDFTQGVGIGSGRVHGQAKASTDFCSSVSTGPLPRGLGRHMRAASFLDAETACVHRPRTLRTAFGKRDDVESSTMQRVDEELERQEQNDHEVMASIEKKVDDKLKDLKDSTERKLDRFFQTMREAYGVPFGAPMRVGGAAPATAAGGAPTPPGGTDGQPWEGAKVKVHLPDLPPGKHATIQLERQPPVAAGGQAAGSQQEALGTLLKRLDTLMRKASGQPPADASEKEALRPEKPLDPGSLSDLYNKLKMVRDNLGGPREDQAQPLATAEGDQGMDEDAEVAGSQNGLETEKEQVAAEDA